MTNISANTVNANQVQANRVNSTRVDATQVYANTFGGAGGGDSGAILVAQKIFLGGWLIEAEGNGIFVTTPGGIKTKMELIDYRETPVPTTADLNLPAQPATPSPEVPGGPTNTVDY